MPPAPAAAMMGTSRAAGTGQTPLTVQARAMPWVERMLRAVPGQYPPPDSLARARLRALWQDLAADRRVGRYCTVYHEPTRSGDAEQAKWLWNHLFLVSLRLPVSQATSVRDRAWDAVNDLPVRPPPYPLPDNLKVAPEVSELTQRLTRRPNGSGLT